MNAASKSLGNDDGHNYKFNCYFGHQPNCSGQLIQNGRCGGSILMEFLAYILAETAILIAIGLFLV
jgi:hypothetical protein